MADFALSQETHILSVPGAGVNGDEQHGAEENFEAVHWHDAAGVQDEEAEEFPSSPPSNCLKIDAMLNHDPPPSSDAEIVQEKNQIDDMLLPLEADSKVSAQE